MSDRPTAIAIAVVEHQGRFLVGRRQSGQVLDGLHEFPGGKIKPGETPEEAAVRECLEETGITVRVVGRLLSHVHRYGHGAVDLNFFACHPATAATSPQAPFRWLSRERLGDCDFPAGNQPLLDGLSRKAFDFSDEAE